MLPKPRQICHTVQSIILVMVIFIFGNVDIVKSKIQTILYIFLNGRHQVRTRFYNTLTIAKCTHIANYSRVSVL